MDPGPLAQIDAAENLGHGSGRFSLAFAHDHHGVRQPQHLIDVVADVDDGNVQLFAHLFQERQDFCPACGVQGSHWLVHQQDRRIGQQCPADGHPLLFPAG